MSVRPTQKVAICHQPDTPLFMHDEICLLDANGNTIEAMRLRTYDPTTLALRAERLINILTGTDAAGIPMACPCDTNGNPVSGALLQSLGGVPLGYLLPLA